MTGTIFCHIPGQIFRCLIEAMRSTANVTLPKIRPTYAPHHSPLGLTCIMGAFFYCAAKMVNQGVLEGGTN